MREKGDQPARYDARFEGGSAFVGVKQKIIRDRASIGVGERAVRGAEMSEPGEACEFAFPVLILRRDLEGEMAMRIDDLAGKSEIAGIDLRRDFGIGVMDVLRRDREPIGALAVISLRR